MTPDELALRSFDRLGHCHLPGAIEPDLVDALEAELRRLEAARDAELPRHAPRTFTPLVNEMRVLNAVECGPAFEALVDHPALLGWVRALVPGPTRLTTAQSITRARGVGLPLHRIDTATYLTNGHTRRCDHVTAVVWLCDVGPEDGPLVVFDGSHRAHEPPPCPRFHPAWELPHHDAEYARAFLGSQERMPPTPWERVAGYREFLVRRGDVVLFAEGLWHGAREVRSNRLRRSLYYSYAPFHCTNWHGLTYSPELLERVTPARRELLSGPYIGSRHDVWPVPGLPDLAEFPRLPESDLGPRRIGPVHAPEPAGRARIARALADAMRRHLLAPDGLDGASGRLHLCADGAGEWTVELAGGELCARPGLDGESAARVELESRALESLLDGKQTAQQLVDQGRVRLTGDVRLALRLASFLFP